MKDLMRSVAALPLVVAAMGHASPMAAQLVARATYVAEGSFQLPAAGPTSPKTPVSFAVHSGGDVHIADREGQVFVFSRTGEPVASYGAGQLGRPVAIAFDAAGSAYVLDRDPNRIQVFANNELQYGIASSGNGPSRFRDPIDIAVGPAGFVYVLDKAGPALRIFGRDGAFVREVQILQSLPDPVSIAIDGDGTILIASSSNAGRVYTFPPFHEIPWTGTMSTQGFAVAATGKAGAVASDATGISLILDTEDRRLWGGQRIEPDQASLARPLYGGIGTGRGSFRSPVDITFTPERDVLILDSEIRKVERIVLSELERTVELTSDFPIRVSLLPPDIDGVLVDVAGPARDVARMMMSSNDGRNISLQTGDGSRFTDYFGGSFRVYALSPEREPLFQATLSRAADDVAFNDTLLVIAEGREDRFTVYDLRDGQSLGSYGDNYGDDRRLRRPKGVDLFSDGSIVVADGGNDRVAIFSADLASLLGQFSFPAVSGVAVSPTGGLFAWDETGERVAEITLETGAMQELSGTLAPGSTRDIAFDESGNLFILEDETSRVTVVSAALDEVFVRFGGRDAEFKAEHISVDNAGNVYLASKEMGRTEVYRWGLELPSMTGLRVTLTADGVEAAWNPIDSPFIAGYRLLGASSPNEEFEVIASTEGESVSYAADIESPLRWVFVAPMTIAGTMTDGSDPVPLMHLDVRASDAAEDPGMVIGYRERLDEFIADGSVGIGDDLVQELEWLSVDAEIELGYYEEAVAREAALEGWEGDDRGLSLHLRLTEAYAAIDGKAEVLDHASRAFELLPDKERQGDIGTDLLRLVVDAAAEVGAFEALTEFGEALVPRVGMVEEYELLTRMATAYLEGGRAAEALATVNDLALREERGDVAGTNEYRADLGWTAVRAGIEVGAPEAVDRWALLVMSTASNERLSEFNLVMGDYRLGQGDVESAAVHLRDVMRVADAGTFADSTAIAVSLGVYRGLQQADTSSYRAGLDFLDEYVAAIPVEATGVRTIYRDSMSVFESREATRARLGPGIVAWIDFNTPAAYPFFEGILAGDELYQHEEIFARALLAGLYNEEDRTDEAMEQLVEILSLADDYDPDEASAEAEALYGVVGLFSDSLKVLLSELRNDELSPR